MPKIFSYKYATYEYVHCLKDGKKLFLLNENEKKKIGYFISIVSNLPGIVFHFIYHYRKIIINYLGYLLWIGLWILSEIVEIINILLSGDSLDPWRGSQLYFWNIWKNSVEKIYLRLAYIILFCAVFDECGHLYLSPINILKVSVLCVWFNEHMGWGSGKYFAIGYLFE